MKKLHKPNLYCWSEFDEDRNIDFHSYLWVRDDGNVVIDPLPLTEHDEEHLHSLGKVTQIIITNSDHVRDAERLSSKTGAEVWGPEAERDTFPIACSKWLGEGDVDLKGLKVTVLHGSKASGELALLIEDSTLITGDLIRAHEGGKLCMLPDAKLTDKKLAVASALQLSEFSAVDAILPGDGWPVFRNGQVVLKELVGTLQS
jgi:glyoxylase-like metal-dependent hydrolase (beta-lactamase superfamily II)